MTANAARSWMFPCSVLAIGLLLILAVLVSPRTVRAQGKVVLEVQPSTVELSPWYERVELRVILQNGETEDLIRPELAVFTNDLFSVKVNPLAVAKVRPLEAVVWSVWVENLISARIPGTIQFEARYRVTNSPGLRRMYSTATLKRQAEGSSQPLDVTVQGSFDSVTETRPGIGRLTIKSNLNVPVKVTSVSILLPDQKSFLAPSSIEPFNVPAKSVETRTITLATAPRVTPGKHAIAFVIQAEWDEDGHHHVRSIVVEKEATVGVFFESEVLKALGVPSFLLLPGALFLFTMQLLVTLGILGVGRYSKVPEVSVTSPGFWILAVTFSGVFAWAYGLVTGTDYLIRYGTRDLRNVWLSSIVLGALTFLALALLTRRRRQQRVPDTRDEQITTLEKLGRRGEGILASRVQFPMSNVSLSAFMLEPINDGQTMVWVTPRIIATWADTPAALQAAHEVGQLINHRVRAEELAEKLRAAARESKPPLVALSWETQGSVPNPFHLKVDSITQYTAQEPIIRMN